MRRFRVKFSDAGYARFEHATESDTDDGLLSLACALWYGENGSEHRYANARLTTPCYERTILSPPPTETNEP